MAVTLGVLSSDTPIGILAGETNTRLMGSFPLSLIPTFFVPLFLIFHLVVLAQLRRRLRPIRPKLLASRARPKAGQGRSAGPDRLGLRWYSGALGKRCAAAL